MRELANVIWLDESDRDKTNVIYMLIFPNWKYYIGQTSRRLDVRIYDHSIISEHTRNKKERAVNKYKTFHVMVLDNCKDLDELNVKERDWIELYDSMRNGYNSTTGGDSFKHSDETRHKNGIIHSIMCKSIPDNITFNSIKQCCDYYKKYDKWFKIHRYLDNGKIHKKSGQTFVRLLLDFDLGW